METPNVIDLNGTWLLTDITAKHALEDCPPQYSVFAVGTVSELIAARWVASMSGHAPDTKVVVIVTPLQPNEERTITILHMLPPTDADALDAMIKALQDLKAR